MRRRSSGSSYSSNDVWGWLVLAAIVIGIGYLLLTGKEADKQPSARPTATARIAAAVSPATAVPQPVVTHRSDCNAIRGTAYESDEERGWYLTYCVGLQTLLPIPSNAERATVTRIIDGDTIDVMINGVVQRIRYFGVDTPERGQACFSEATERNRALAGQTVLLIPDVRNVDPYGRLLRYALTSDGVFIDATLVSQGYGRAWTRDGSYRSRIIALENQAVSSHTGCLWR